MARPTTFGTLLRKARWQRDLTQAALAQLAGISRNYLSQLETDQKRPSLRTLQALARVLTPTPRMLRRWVQLASAPPSESS